MGDPALSHSTAYLLVALIALAACAAPRTSRGGTAPQQRLEAGLPLQLVLPRSYVPPPGLCRIYYPDRPEESEYIPPQGCDDIENNVMAGGVVLFRPRDASSDVHVCYMSRTEPGVVDGIEAVSVDSLRVVRVILRRLRRTAANTRPCTYDP